MPPKQDSKRGIQPRTESKTNIVGKFTTSVKKFVQDVESDHTREGAIKTNERLRLVSGKITESYVTIKRTLTTLHEQYEDSKSERNIIRKYSLFKSMIKTVIKLDTQYWVLLDVPKQEKQEQMSVYVLRCCSSLEKALDTRTSDGAKTKAERQAEEDQREKDRKQRFDGYSIAEIEEENKQAINDLYRLIKKYLNLKKTVHELKVSYVDSKIYPFLPRYIMLKDMIKVVLRDPHYMEVCHENC